MGNKQNAEIALMEKLKSLRKDPLAFAMFAFPWGEPGTELANQDGPDEWQISVLKAIRDQLQNPNTEPIQIAIASGNGSGKTTLIAWLALWGLCTMTDARGIVTAITDQQLKTRTWAELSKWYRLLICKHWFTLTATALFSVLPEHERTWRLDAIPWSPLNPQAVAGLHNARKRLMWLFDEASGIDDSIFDAASGAMTDESAERIWIVAGNPTKPAGAFFECFHKFKHRWMRWNVDTRKSKLADKAQIEKWIQDYGLESDYCKIHILGEFPSAGSLQFISSEIVQDAVNRQVAFNRSDPLLLGVDVARYGDDQSVIVIRKGRDARTYPALKFRGLDTMELAAKVMEIAERFRPDGVFVDGGGVGAGVVDRLRQLNLNRLYEIQFGGKPQRSLPSDATVYANRRAELWGFMREWLKGGGIPNDPELIADLVGPEFFYTFRDGRDALCLESKDDMRRRGLSSPDYADALALTFAYNIAPSEHAGFDGAYMRPRVQTDYSLTWDEHRRDFVAVPSTVPQEDDPDRPGFRNVPVVPPWQR
jgi:hypothetical protein